MRVPFLGIGTGRCGSNSLVKILNACKDVNCTKTEYPMNWYGPGSTHLVAKFLAASASNVLVGDVCEYHLPHLVWYRKKLPKLKIVALHRERQAVVDSMAKYTAAMLRPVDKSFWLGKGKKEHVINRYPIIDAATQEQAFGFFWDMYETESALIPQPVFHLDTEDLNDDARVSELFDFLDIPVVDRVFIERRNFDPFKEESEAVWEFVDSVKKHCFPSL